MTGRSLALERHLVVFDLDGTLVNSLQDLAESANALLEECGGAPLTHADVGAMVGDGAATLVARVFAAARLPPSVDALSRFLEIYNARLMRHTRPYPGVRDTLEVLAHRHDLGVLTNKPLHATREILAGLDLARFFRVEYVLGGDGPFPRKPDPAGLRHLMRLAETPASRTILVGDSSIDWQTAKAADACACLARFGFGFHSMSLAGLRDRDRVLTGMADLLAFL